MLSFTFSLHPWEFVQANTPLQPVQQAFTGLIDPENMLTFLQTPAFQLFVIAFVAITVFIIGVHVWAWVKMLLDKENTTPVPATKKRAFAPPSQSYAPAGLLWQSGRVGFVPEFGLVDHKTDEPESTRGESAPTRGGDLP